MFQFMQYVCMSLTELNVLKVFVVSRIFTANYLVSLDISLLLK